MWIRFVAFPLAVAAGLVVAALLAVGLVIVLAYPQLPSLEALTAYQPKIPLRIYTAEGILMGEFGEERRAVVAIAEVPERLKNAVIAAEDERFYEHPGIDYVGVMRAALARISPGYAMSRVPFEQMMASLRVACGRSSACECDPDA